MGKKVLSNFGMKGVYKTKDKEELYISTVLSLIKLFPPVYMLTIPRIKLYMYPGVE